VCIFFVFVFVFAGTVATIGSVHSCQDSLCALWYHGVVFSHNLPLLRVAVCMDGFRDQQLGLGQMTPEMKDQLTWELSQDTPAAAELEQIVAQAKALQTLKKDVHFYKDSAASRFVLFVATKDATTGHLTFTHKQNGFTAQELLQAEFLVAQPIHTAYDGAKMAIVKDVDVQFADKGSSNVPKAIRFWSGGQYALSDGYSVYYCKYLERTVRLEIQASHSAVPPSTRAKVEDMDE